MHMLEMDELIRRIEAADGPREYDIHDALGTEIRQVLDHLRATLHLMLHQRLQHGVTDRNLWLH